MGKPASTQFGEISMNHSVVADAPPAESQTVNRARAAWGTTVAVSLLASAIAAVNITGVSMWTDEAATVSAATRPLPDLWRMIMNIDVVHGLYAVILHPVLAVFGVSELTLRLPSLLAVGVATAGVMVLTRQLATPQAALAAGLIFAVLPRVTWMGIEGRSYAATAAVAVWLTVLLVILVRQPTWRKYLIYAIVAAFGCSLNIFLILLLAAHGCYLQWERSLRFSRLFWTWLTAAGVGSIGGLPVLLTALTQTGQIGESRLDAGGFLRSIMVNQWFLGDTPTIFYSGGSSVGDPPGSVLWKYSSVLLAGLCWLLVLWAMLPRTPDEPKVVPSYRALLVCWIAVPTLILAGYAIVATPIYNPRYLTFCAPAVAILLGVALIKLRRLPGRLAWSPVVAALLIFLLALPVFISQRTLNAKSGADWKQISEFVAAHPGSDRAVYFSPRHPPNGEDVVLTSRTAQILYPAAFNGIRDLTARSSPASEANLWGRSRTLAASSDQLAGVKSVFVIERVGYPEAARDADARILVDAGFKPGDQWVGTLDSVVLYTR